MGKNKMNDSKKEVLLQAMQRLDELQARLEPVESNVIPSVEGKLIIKDDAGLPSEEIEYKGMTFKEALYKAREMENEAIEINLLLLELATDDRDIKNFIEIANDENSHDVIYAKIIERIEKEGKK